MPSRTVLTLALLTTLTSALPHHGPLQISTVSDPVTTSIPNSKRSPELSDAHLKFQKPITNMHDALAANIREAMSNALLPGRKPIVHHKPDHPKHPFIEEYEGLWRKWLEAHAEGLPAYTPSASPSAPASNSSPTSASSSSPTASTSTQGPGSSSSTQHVVKEGRLQRREKGNLDQKSDGSPTSCRNLKDDLTDQEKTCIYSLIAAHMRAGGYFRFDHQFYTCNLAGPQPKGASTSEEKDKWSKDRIKRPHPTGTYIDAVQADLNTFYDTFEALVRSGDLIAINPDVVDNAEDFVCKPVESRPIFDSSGDGKEQYKRTLVVQPWQSRSEALKPKLCQSSGFGRVGRCKQTLGGVDSEGRHWDRSRVLRHGDPGFGPRIPSNEPQAWRGPGGRGRPKLNVGDRERREEERGWDGMGCGVEGDE